MALWPEIKGANIFVTGASGFFGRWLLESLISANDRYNLGTRVIALSRNPELVLENAPHLAGSGLSWVKGSVSTLSPEALDGEKVDLVIHLATEADMSATHNDPSAAVAVIADGTRRVLEVAKRTGARRLLFTSSGAVYGIDSRVPGLITEQQIDSPGTSAAGTIYALPGKAKRQAELLCIESAKRDGIGAVIARGFTFAGPGLPTESKFAFGNFIRDALSGSPIVIKGDGTSIRSYLYAADLTVWLWTLLLKGEPGRAYNVGSEREVSIRELASMLSRELGNPEIKVMGNPVPGARPERYVPSTKRARTELGLTENFTLPEIIRKSAEWQRASMKY